MDELAQCGRRWCMGVGLSLALLVGALTPSSAASLLSVDQLLVGDDPSERFEFAPTAAPEQPSVLRFTGIVANQDERIATAVRFDLLWREPGGGVGLRQLPEPPLHDDGGLPLPAADPDPVAVPVDLGVALAFTPGWVLFTVEGLGPSDNFRLVGELTLTAIPEPGALPLIALGAAFIGCCRRRL